MVEGGMTPLQAIVAGTKMAARCMVIGDDGDTLEAGRAADLIIVDGDPLREIGVLAQPSGSGW